MMLYQVTTMVPEFACHRNVPISWCLIERTGLRPYAALIEDYNPTADCRRAEAAVDELFNEEQAAALKAHLDREHGPEIVTTVEEAKVPFPNNVIGCEDMYGCSLMWGPLNLPTTPGYDLPFEVWGYFDLRHCEPIPGRNRSANLTFESAPWLVDADD